MVGRARSDITANTSPDRWRIVTRHAAWPPRVAASVAGGHLNLPEVSVPLFVRPGGEIQHVQRPGRGTVPEADAPEAVDLDRVVVLAQDAVRMKGAPAMVRTERVDQAVSEIADQQTLTEFTEVRRRHRDAPW